jgi:hypothetical protein
VKSLVVTLATVNKPVHRKDVTAPLRSRRYRRKRKAIEALAANLAKKSSSDINPAVTIVRSTNHRATRALRRRGATAVGIGAVAVTLTALSLSHLAHGIELVTHADAWESWAMAIAIDLGFVALELSQLATVSDNVRQQVPRFARPAIWGALAGSAAMNAFAFAAKGRRLHHDGRGDYVGRRHPALVYALTRVGAGLWINCHARA